MQGYVVRIAGEGEKNYINELRFLATRLGVNDIIHFEGGYMVIGSGSYFNRQIYLFCLHIAKILEL